MKAYCRESFVFQSLMTSHEVTTPNFEKIISKSSDYVTGLSLQTNNTFLGGSISASGKSSSISSTCALFLASVIALSDTNSYYPFIICKSMSSSKYTCYYCAKSCKVFDICFYGDGDLEGYAWLNSKSASLPSNGSSITNVCRILMFCKGLKLSYAFTNTWLILSKTWKDSSSATYPKMVCFLSKWLRC